MQISFQKNIFFISHCLCALIQTHCLPVVSARLNPELGLHYDDKDFQHALSESHWYVSGYSLGFENPATFEFEDLFTDVDQVRVNTIHLHIIS